MRSYLEWGWILSSLDCRRYLHSALLLEKFKRATFTSKMNAQMSSKYSSLYLNLKSLVLNLIVPLLVTNPKYPVQKLLLKMLER